ncbi:MAG: hypothetical protein WDM96_12720 [Lacunisphaera sp.]
MTHDVLLAVGVTLFVFGIIARGLARSHRRTLAARKLHELDVGPAGAPASKFSHLEKYANHYATGLMILGGVIAIAGVFR